MSVMQQSSKAQDRTLGVWFQHIEQGMIKLPRFQRLEAWDRGRVTSFLNTIINNLPVGVTLALEVHGPEKFESHYIATATPKSVGTVTQQLLDGQQRLTAFWRSMHNNYDSETYFVRFREFDKWKGDDENEIEVRCIPRYVNKNQLRMPRWAGDSEKCLERGLVPISLLRPGDMSTEVDAWLNDATKPLEPSENEPDAFAKLKAYTATKDRIKSAITELRERIAHFNLPYLSLPAGTDKDVALQVFINMNTNSKPLSLYDIVVAEVERATEKPLRALEVSLIDEHPDIAHYGDVANLILSTSALLQEKPPSTRGMIEMDKKLLVSKWPLLESGLTRMTRFLAGQGVFDEARLPTNAVLAVIAAAYELIPENGDFLAKAEKLLRQYLWSAFFTDRYENTAPTRAFADFRAIRTLLEKQTFQEADVTSVPVLNRTDYPLADGDVLLSAGWPKGAGIVARGILAITTRLGALDFADHQRASYSTIQGREYHHIFPDALLEDAKIDSYKALNCALITWKTNRIIGRKDPLEYLKERVVWANEDVIRDRLKSHLIAFDMLSAASYGGLEGDALRQKLQPDFEAFLRDRAARVSKAIAVLANGDEPSIEQLMKPEFS